MKKEKKLTVYGGSLDGRTRIIVAEYSKAAAVRRVKAIQEFCMLSRYNFDGWWSQTHNDTELATATEPGVWRKTDHFSKTYERVHESIR